MNKVKISLVLNIVNICLIFFAVIAMLTGFKFMGDDTILALKGASAFQFFTFDSNLLMGIVSIIYVAYLIMVLKGKREEIPKIVHLMKYISTVAVSLTMFTVVFFLAPFLASSYFSLFLNSNLVFHFLAPLISIIAFIFFDKYKQINKKEIWLGLAPTILYGIYYSINVFIHMEGGSVEYKYDWYGFAQGGAISIILSILLMNLSTLLIGFLIYLVNKKVNKKEVKEYER